MNGNVQRILRIYVNLSLDERKELREQIDEFENLNYRDKERKRSNLNDKRILGPTSQNPCPYCGR